MGTTSLYVIGFLVCSVIIFFAGKKLSFYGDLLAEVTGMGRAWVGLILMAAVTSLPELMVGFSSAAIVGSADLAVGDILGSCAFNLGILSFMDVFTSTSQPLMSRVSKSHILAAAFGVILLALVGLNIFLDRDITLKQYIGLSSISFLFVYLIAVKTLFSHQKLYSHSEQPDILPQPTQTYSKKEIIQRYAFFAGVIVIAALALPFFAEHIAEQTGLGKSFVGTLFLAISTSLPEIAVSVAAVRLGFIDMAVGNLLGSNLFNILILFLDDVFYTKGHLLKDASDVNLLTVFFIIMMTGVAIIGFIFPSKEKKFFLAWDTFSIFVLYIINMVLLYTIS